MPTAQQHDPAISRLDAWTIFLVFLRLGLTSFGGPIAHLGYFRHEFVQRRRWLDERSYADLVALCQFLPGPASSQVGLAIGLLRGGYRGSLAAWAGFTLPSAVALAIFALGIASWGEALPHGVLQGLKVVAVAVVAQAVWGMARTLCTDGPRVVIALASASAVLLLPFVWGQVGVIVAAGLLGLLIFRPIVTESHVALPVAVSSRAALTALAVFVSLLALLPLLASGTSSQALAQVDAFYRTGALVFGGGHVVLPLLQAEVVPSGWVDNDSFLAGYGAAQAVPGPLFTFAAFLGASMSVGASGWLGAALCLVAVFAPSFLLVIGVLPFWERLRSNRRTQAALAGVNAAVVGLILAALYDPVWTSGIKAPEHFILALLALAALMYWKLPPWLVVVGGAYGGWALTLVL
ncbi:chromate efflux transporter [Pseudomonas stutzeri]|uniref:Chromate transporter n=1 Tax=Stutzerimonas stutzeri TaxID=316 RepID=A0A2N8S7P7_STUST|nr:chromate efflux transporter [Stutzerimonas stutzeri]MCQ4294964.1 chromate efflux transporter [Stutzerimonas stutzeri]PNF82642.1 chromate transporter [Stutzerimonas stutzeri]